MNIMGILTQIDWAKGKDKIKVIESVNDPIALVKLKEIVEATYKQGISYHITDVEKVVPEKTTNLFELDDVEEEKVYYQLSHGLEFLRLMNLKGSADNEDRRKANHFYSNMLPDEAEIFRRIIRRDLKCGASIKTFRKVFGKDFCPDFPKSLCSTYDENSIIRNIDFPAYSQLKSDGARAHFFPTHSPTTGYVCGFYTRNGSLIPALNKLKIRCEIMVKEFSHNLYVLDGELVVVDEDGETLPREIGNGIINKCIKGTAKLHEINRIRFVVWDAIPYEEFIGRLKPTLPYSTRFEILEKIVETGGTLVKIVETKTVNSIQEAKAHYHEMINREEEGTILKDLNGVWGNKRLKSQFKFKEEHDFDALITGWYGGKKGSKYEMYVGGYHCESKCGKLKFDVGSGLTDENRKQDGDYWVGKIAECKYNYRTMKENGEQSLYLPRVVELREDKSGRDEANTIEELIAQEKASRELKE